MQYYAFFLRFPFLRSLQIIKYCATFYMVFGIGLITFIALSNEDDKPGGYMLGAIIILISCSVAAGEKLNKGLMLLHIVIYDFSLNTSF